MQTTSNRIRSALARRFLVNIKRASHRMPVQLEAPRTSRVLVVAPHMDDEVIACGGTLLLHKELGSRLRVVFVSDSSSGVADPAVAEKVKAVRRAEMLGVQQALQYEARELGFPDGALMRHEAGIAERLAEELREFQPEQVLCPFPVDAHADHQACAIALAEAAHMAKWQGEVLAYEVWSTLWPNMAVDISRVAEAKAGLIGMYPSQMSDRDYASAVLGLNRYRGLAHRLAHAEAYHRCTPAQFRALAQCLDQL